MTVVTVSSSAMLARSRDTIVKDNLFIINKIKTLKLKSKAGKQTFTNSENPHHSVVLRRHAWPFERGTAEGKLEMLLCTTPNCHSGTVTVLWAKHDFRDGTMLWHISII